MIMEILNICMTKECRVWTIKDNYRLGEDIQSKVLAFAFGLSAEIERNLISPKNKRGFGSKRKPKALYLDVPKDVGAVQINISYRGKWFLLMNCSKNGTSLRKIAKICKVDRNTLSRFLKLEQMAAD